MNHSKGIILIILGIFALAIASIYVALRLSSTNTRSTLKTPPTTLKTNSDQTPTPEEWLQYKNEAYSFNYPPEATLNTNTPDTITITYMGEKQKASGRTQTELFDGYSFSLATLGTISSQSLLEYAKNDKTNSEQNCIRDEGVVSDFTQLTLAGKPAYQYSVKNCYVDYIETVVADNSYAYRITQVTLGEEVDTVIYANVLDRILASLKFTQ